MSRLSISARISLPRSMDSSSLNERYGMVLMVSRRSSSLWMNRAADDSALRVFRLSASVPYTLTNTLAYDRSTVASTRMMLTMPEMRGSLISVAIILLISERNCALMRSVLRLIV